MSPLIKFLNVSFYKDQAFGIRDAGFELLKYRRYHLLLPNQDKLETMLGLLEGRFRPQAGIIHHYGQIFTQSDRQLLGGKVYQAVAGNFLKLEEEQFYFEDRKRSKQNFLHSLKARHIRHFPIYKLRGDDRLKFALLALTFQETGLIVISELLTRQLSPDLEAHFLRMIRGSQCAICLVTSAEQDIKRIEALRGDKAVTRIDLQAV